MSDYERARQEIEKRTQALKIEAEQNRQKALEQAEQERHAREERERQKTIRDELERVKQETVVRNKQAAIGLLEKVNTEIFRGQGKVKPWTEVKDTWSEEIEVRESPNKWNDFNEGKPQLKTFDGNFSGLQANLSIPNAGGIGVAVPAHYYIYFSEVKLDPASVYVFSTGRYRELRRSHVNGNGISLSTQSDEFTNLLERQLIEKAIVIEAQRRARS